MSLGIDRGILNKMQFQKQKNKTLESMLRIGRCYETGDGVGKNLTEAVKWYRMAAEQGHAQGMFELSKCYTFGFGVRKNRVTAEKWLRMAAEHGHVTAMFLLGQWHLREVGGGVGYNPREAAKWFRRAADNGDARAMFELGECYEDGVGVKNDPDKAYRWFCRAVLAAPEDEYLYERVQNHIFDPNLKTVREELLADKKQS